MSQKQINDRKRRTIPTSWQFQSRWHIVIASAIHFAAYFASTINFCWMDTPDIDRWTKTRRTFWRSNVHFIIWVESFWGILFKVCHSSAFQTISVRSVYNKIINESGSIYVNLYNTMQTKQLVTKNHNHILIETRLTVNNF